MVVVITLAVILSTVVSITLHLVAWFWLTRHG